jgi:hypothetical protein
MVNNITGTTHFIFASNINMFFFLKKKSDVTAGYNGTVFAYGQTGSGKTYTMMVY